jgi:phage terminase large subunit-like protein
MQEGITNQPIREPESRNGRRALGDAREVMIDGISGIGRIARRNRTDFEISRRRLIWPNGAVAQIFSSEDPESLRGPQFHLAWSDELTKWKHGQETWDMLQFGLRLGQAPPQLRRRGRCRC